MHSRHTEASVHTGSVLSAHFKASLDKAQDWATKDTVYQWALQRDELSVMQSFYNNFHRMKIDCGGDGRRRGAGRRRGNWWRMTHFLVQELSKGLLRSERIIVHQTSPTMPNVTWGWDQLDSIFNCDDAFRLWCMWNDTPTNVGGEEGGNERLKWERETNKMERLWNLQ